VRVREEERGAIVLFLMITFLIIGAVAVLLPIGYASVLRARTATAADAAAIAAGVEIRRQLVETLARLQPPHVYSEELVAAAAGAYALRNGAVLTDISVHDDREALVRVHSTDTRMGGVPPEVRARSRVDLALLRVRLIDLE